MKIYNGLLFVLFLTVHRANAGFSSFFSSISEASDNEENAGFVSKTWSMISTGANVVGTGVKDFAVIVGKKTPGVISSAWSTAEVTVGTVATGVKNVASIVAEKSPGVINSAWSTAEVTVGTVATGVKNVASIVVEKSPGVVNSAWSTAEVIVRTAATGVKKVASIVAEKSLGVISRVWSTAKVDVDTVVTENDNAKESPGFIQSIWTTFTTKEKNLFNWQSEDSSLDESIDSTYSKGYWGYITDRIKNVFGDKFPFNFKEPEGVFATDDDCQYESTSFSEFIQSYWSSYTGWVKSSPLGEECTDEWIPGDIKSLEQGLRSRLYGQDMVINLVPHIIRYHWSEGSKRNKPLALSLHGATGVGKNYVANIIVQSLFKLGDKSKFFTMYSGRLDFPEAYRVKEYQDKLRNDLVKKVTDCERHVFIFDEIDKVPKGLLDVLKPFIDHNMKVRDKDFRKTIFIFISNLGQLAINKRQFEHWQQGILRKNFAHFEFEKILRDDVFNKEGGLQKSANIEFHLIDFYVPFLMLEAQHVKECIRYEFRKTHNIFEPTNEEIEAVHNYVEYGPETNPIFAKTGCKALNSKVALIASLRNSEL